MLQVKTLYHTEKQGFGYPWLSKRIPDTLTKPAETKPSFSLPPAKLRMLFPTHLWVRETNLLSKILASTKMDRA